MEHRRIPAAARLGQPGDVFDDGGAAWAVVDQQGIVTGWSEGARQLLGHRPDEVVGKPAVRLLDEDLPPETLREIKALRRWSGRVRLRHRNGHRVECGLIAHDRTKSDTGSDWLLVCPITGAITPEDKPLIEQSFQQSPCCALNLFDTHARLRRANAYAESALGLTEAEMRGLRVSEFDLDPEIARIERAVGQALETGEPQHLETYGQTPGESREHAWSMHAYPVRDESGAVRGVGVAGHDMTEQYWARKRLQLLNDASVLIGSTLDVARTAQELAEVAVPEFADFATVDLLVGSGPRPGTAHPGAVRLRRVAHQSILPGIPEAVVPLGEVDAYAVDSPTAECLATGKAVLRAEFDASNADWSMGHPSREAAVRAFKMHSVMAVPLRARGTTFGIAVFIRHQRQEPFSEDDLLLAEELTGRAAVFIDNARRYTHERDTATALQKTLLPQQLPQPTAVEVASRYLPASALAGVGGDWFDVIPLSSARVALVVGDVVGHGIQAAATMGQLRTAVRTLADVDLQPDELLIHLDDLVVRLAADADTGGASPADQVAEAAGGLGATCLYAVYDPVSQTCTLASAGHPMPALLTPEGTVDFLDAPVGPPLGLGGLPFEATKVALPEGSILALYTDGLIGSRNLDIDEGLARLRTALARPAVGLDNLCDTVISALPPEVRTDDIALLIARTHTLDARHVASWDLPADPAIVAQARRLVAAQLMAWDLMEVSFVTELIISELVTNAIRHAAPPIQLRLIHDRHLICEVSDASNTAPHLRRAQTYDEGGRGLLLVAQLTRGWGTRHGETGKTIWAEQALDATQPGM
ncbi:SpoIIE family protein phosphatase [Streptomyces neyagawaensis]|uniref:SpoIIE family protein phosphatase n=1 Tax=Streptomyces neyagawaensis TaxID=42238 RepID=UPI0006E2A9F8|nr:SpoIIE family protein phosphatase [Streptomyces neyagawaensis]MCL6732289.1 SpoIIE family protein phosphatase [Streptomyces neyagawaensis]MDE1685770.1 SpoIIE family protein phosphatase [Streptomyces neyagawaensis]